VNLESKYIEEYLPYLIEFDYLELFKEIISQDKKRLNFIFSSSESHIEKCSLIAHSINQKRTEFTSFLLSNDVDVNIEIIKSLKDDEGNDITTVIAPIHLAILNKNNDMVELLIKKGFFSFFFNNIRC
jgi:hypothetical protein